MSDNVTKYLGKFLSKADGITGIFITDKDGVIMVKATSGDIVDKALQPFIQSAFISTVNQADKFGLGRTRKVVTRYNDMIICQYNFAADGKYNVYATVVGAKDADIGMMMGLEGALHNVVEFLSPLADSMAQNARGLHGIR